MSSASGARMRTFFFFALGALGACTPLEIAPPAAPRAIVPSVPDLHATAVAPGSGRVVLDAEPGPAEVSRVVSESDVGLASGMTYRRYRALQPMEVRQTQLLCITPCVVDLPIGAHRLVFREQTPEGQRARTSTATIAVHGGEPLVVRHAIGDETISYGAGYLLGWVAATVGFSLTLMSGFAFALAGAGSKSTDASRNTMYEVAGVIGGMGLALDVTGVLAIVLGRPHHQNGATTAFTF